MFYVILGIAFCIVPLLAYRKGLKDGLAIKQNEPITPLIKNPVKAVKEYKEEKEISQKDKEKLEELEEWLGYGGDIK
ncbi:hypothetical protein SH1V18_03340 [Vallitalea longa]|uniref:Uncharacterized protein n=1 Tax=Vallitalea longa TaxID=2936439 RepID=A0A9W5Y7S0_9FIRM|nr:hypothetical protein [Vallitalea longa]GKX27854.1 hypothetical protein SH1V18_03340 [Vallitalea longa]